MGEGDGEDAAGVVAVAGGGVVPWFGSEGGEGEGGGEGAREGEEEREEVLHFGGGMGGEFDAGEAIVDLGGIVDLFMGRETLGKKMWWMMGVDDGGRGGFA